MSTTIGDFGRKVAEGWIGVRGRLGAGRERESI